MVHVFSFTDTCCNVLNGHLTLEQLKDAKFYFGCKKEHVFREGTSVPYEATWANRHLPRQSSSNTKIDDVYTYGVDISTVDPGKRQLLKNLIKAIKLADAAGNVQWKSVSSSILRDLPKGETVFRNGRLFQWDDCNE